MNFGVAIVMAYRYKHPGHANDNYSQCSLDRDEGGEIEISSANSNSAHGMAGVGSWFPNLTRFIGSNVEFYDEI